MRFAGEDNRCTLLDIEHRPRTLVVDCTLGCGHQDGKQARDMHRQTIIEVYATSPLPLIVRVLRPAQNTCSATPNKKHSKYPFQFPASVPTASSNATAQQRKTYGNAYTCPGLGWLEFERTICTPYPCLPSVHTYMPSYPTTVLHVSVNPKLGNRLPRLTIFVSALSNTQDAARLTNHSQHTAVQQHKTARRYAH